MNQEMVLPLLYTIRDARQPVGATYLAEKLHIPQTSIGRILLQLEKDGLLTKMSNKGRCLTADGLKYLEQQKNQAFKMGAVENLLNSVESTSQKRLIEILEIRKLLEGQAAMEACKNATDSQLAELNESLEEYKSAIALGSIGNEEDMALHLTIARVSGNLAMYQILKIILTQENGYIKISEKMPGLNHAAADEHTQIINAILHRNAREAQLAMVHHLDSLICYVKTI